jgi:predicted RND superfamily exporter protein
MALERFFKLIIARRWLVIAFYALLLPPAVWFALKVDQDNSIYRLIVPSDPDSLATAAFEKVFGRGEYVVLLAEASDPFAPEVIKKVDDLSRDLSKLPRVQSNSLTDIYRRSHAGLDSPEAFKKFATGTDLFKKQGLVGPDYLGIPLLLNVQTNEERRDVIAKIDELLAPVEQSPAPLTKLRKVGMPYVNAYLDKDTRNGGKRYFPVFFLFVLLLNYTLYRSFRALLAFVITLGVSAALTVGYIGATGGTFTIFSQLVPMTILITCTATLVYLHSRFVEIPPDRDVEEHRLFALRNKFMACTASMAATAVGFAALLVSKIRPIREMGMWVAIGLGLTWVVVFTLFPALQKALNAPTQKERQLAAQWFVRLTNWLPTFSWRWRWLLVPGSLVLCAAGAVALFGIPHVWKPMELQTNALHYLNHNSALYKDTKRIEETVGGLSVTDIWLKSDKTGSVTDAEVLEGITAFAQSLEADPRASSVVGLPTLLRTIRYASGEGDQLPALGDKAAWEKIADTLESLMPKESMLSRFVEPKSLAQTHLAVITKTIDYKQYVALDALIKQKFAEAAARFPALKSFTVQNVGLAALEAKISHHLVPTLVESFWLTVVIIFGTFLVIFRNGAARLMAMIPSLFAILVMFLVMRVSSISLSVATIMIASTVLGTSENDQIHFFFHFLEKSKGSSTEEGLKHTLLIAGRAIFFATLINAGGFLAFGLADLPPMREFGMLSALAFLLSMIADFTALPAALWMVFRDRPEAMKEKPAKKG